MNFVRGVWMFCVLAVACFAGKPAIVLVHGLTGISVTWKPVADALAARGYSVSRVSLTGTSERAHLAGPAVGLEVQITDVVNHVLYEDLHDVVLVAHSSSGFMITGAADRLQGRVRSLIFVDAFIPESGESMADYNGRLGYPLDEKNLEGVGLRVVDGMIFLPWVKEDAMPPKDMPISKRLLFDKLVLTKPDTLKLPGDYLFCTDDGKVPSEDNRPRALALQRCRERGYRIHAIASDHNIQTSHPEALAGVIDACVSR